MRVLTGAISCRGDAYLRTLLIQGARSSLQRAKDGQRGEVHARTDLDTPAGLPDAIRQGARGDRQQTRAAAVGDAGARGRYDPSASLRHPLAKRAVSIVA